MSDDAYEPRGERDVCGCRNRFRTSGSSCLRHVMSTRAALSAFVQIIDWGPTQSAGDVSRTSVTVSLLGHGLEFFLETLSDSWKHEYYSCRL